MSFEGLVNVCVFIGGCSVEHEISLISGLQTVLNLDKSKYNVRVVYLSKNNEFVCLKSFDSLEVFKNGNYLKWKSNCYFKRIKGKTYLVCKGKKWKVDVCFPVVHGHGVEDGSLSGFIKLLKVPNVCSDILSSGVAQDKAFCKSVLKSKGIRMNKFIEVSKDNLDKQMDKIILSMRFPLIIKPSTLGSSIGIEVCEDKESLKSCISNCLNYDNKVIVEEKLVDFVEYNMACFSYKQDLYLSSVEMVSSKHDYLTFDDKYCEGGLKDLNKESRVVPALIDEDLKKEISNFTKTIYKKLMFNGVVRVDYLYDNISKKLMFNEVNTIPGSLAFYLYKDYSFKELLDLLIKDAMYRFNLESGLISSFDSNILAIKNLSMKK